MFGENAGEVMLGHGIPTMRGATEGCDFPFGIACYCEDCGAGAQHFGSACGETARELRGTERRIQLQRGGGELREQALERAIETR